MSLSILARAKFAWAVITGRIVPTDSLERMIFMADLTNTTAAIAALNASADRLIAKSQSDAAALAPLQADLANVDANVAAQITPITAKIDAIVPPPAA